LQILITQIQLKKIKKSIRDQNSLTNQIFQTPENNKSQSITKSSPKTELNQSKETKDDQNSIALSIKFDGEQKFSGVLIKTNDSYAILTNAHCVNQSLKSEVNPKVEICGRNYNLKRGFFIRAATEMIIVILILEFFKSKIFHLKIKLVKKKFPVCEIAPYTEFSPQLSLHTNLNKKKIQAIQIYKKKELHFHNIPLANGNSGSPIVYQVEENYYVVGIHCGVVDEKHYSCCMFNQIAIFLIDYNSEFRIEYKN